jgi:Zn-dependent protease with chaperone function
MMKASRWPVLTGFLAAWAVASAAQAEQKGKVNGLAEFRKDGILVVDGQRVRLVERTKIKGVPSADELALGSEVKAKGTWQNDGVLEAKQLEVKPSVRDEKEEELLEQCDRIEAIYNARGQALRMAGNSVVSLGAVTDHGKQHQRARAILDRLLPPYVARDQVRLYLVANPEWNAFAMANFAIYVHTGLLDDLDDDEVSIVLGHELAHATLKHSRRSMKKSRWAKLAGGLAVVGGTVLSVAGRGNGLYDLGGDAVAAVGGLGATALNNGFSRGFEDEADRVGLRYAYEGGFEAEKAPELWRRVAEKYGDASGVNNFLFGSHSQSKDRARNMEAELARNYEGNDTPSHH